jgi:hypothetical protein
MDPCVDRIGSRLGGHGPVARPRPARRINSQDEADRPLTPIQRFGRRHGSIRGNPLRGDTQGFVSHRDAPPRPLTQVALPRGAYAPLPRRVSRPRETRDRAPKACARPRSGRLPKNHHIGTRRNFPARINSQDETNQPFTSIRRPGRTFFLRFSFFPCQNPGSFVHLQIGGHRLINSRSGWTGGGPWRLH